MNRDGIHKLVYSQKSSANIPKKFQGPILLIWIKKIFLAVMIAA